MRIVAMSDSHTSFSRVSRIVQGNLEADLFIHLGDGEEEFDEVAMLFPDKAFLGVKGNNDWQSTKQATDFITCEGVKIMFTHGDMYSVKWGMERLIKEGVKQNAKIVLYGHTHIARCDYIDGRYYINPGSVVDSRMTKAGYLVIDITEAGIVPVFRHIEPSPEEY